MRVGYVVLYVTNAEACRDFWIEKIGMTEQSVMQAGPHTIYKVGFNDQQFSFELVPLALMENNPDGLDLATPSIAFYVPDIKVKHSELTEKGISTTPITDMGGRITFAFADNEDKYFAVIESR